MNIPDLRVVLTAHEDWLINLLLSDGRVYCYATECWLSHYPPHPDDPEQNTNWPRTVHEARERALDDAVRQAAPFCADIDASLVTTEAQLMDVCSQACVHMNDADFNRLVRA